MTPRDDQEHSEQDEGDTRYGLVLCNAKRTGRSSSGPGRCRHLAGWGTDHPGFGLVDVYAALLPKLRFEPGVHVNYAETVLHIHDGKPKLKDFPKELGGSGISVPE